MVPEGWTSHPMSYFGEVHAGRQRSPNFTKGDLRPYLRVANVFDGYIDTSDVLEMHFSDAEYQRYRLQSGDILLNEGQSLKLVGRPAMYQGDPRDCCFQNTLVRFRPNEKVCSAFALYQFQRCLYEGTFQKIAKKTTSIAHLGVSRFANLKLSWPPIPEQQKTACILSTWDKAIETVEKLIKNSKAQKKALSQQLLMGKRRFPRFTKADRYFGTKYGSIPSDWIFPKLGDIAEEVHDRNGGKSDIPVLACSKHGGFVDSLKYFKKKVFSNDTSNYKIVTLGTFGFPSNHIEEGSIGYQNLYEIGLVSPIYTVFKTAPEVHDGYLYKLLKTEHYRQIFAASTNASVDRRGSLRWREFSRIRIPLPPLEEQEAISDAIDQADKELANYLSHLANLVEQKKSLMQQLLTGKRRVKVDEA